MSAEQALHRGRRTLALFIMLAGIILLLQGGFTVAKAHLSQTLLQQSWDKTLGSQDNTRPWPWADTWPVAKIQAPRLGKSNIVLAEAGGEALAFGPSLLNAGGRPGKAEDILISAHKNTHFSWLKDLKSGDTLTLQDPTGDEKSYQVTGMQVVRFDASGISAQNKGNRLALITCYPFDAGFGGPLRYIVWAEAVPSATS